MNEAKELLLQEIDLPENNMREHVDRDSIFELADDIRKNGLINPITVRPKNNRYELVAGQRRYLAHQYGGMLSIKCVVRELTDDEALAVMTSENLNRVDVNPVDEAKHISRLVEVKNGDVKEVARMVGRSESWVKDRIVVSKMPDYMQEYLAKKELKLGVALILFEITDEATRKSWTEEAIRCGATIPLAEYWLADFKRRLLPGGELSGANENGDIALPPQAILFTCGIDGKQYDTRFARSLLVYEGNLEIFKAFVSEFRLPPAENEFASGGE